MKYHFQRGDVVRIHYKRTRRAPRVGFVNRINVHNQAEIRFLKNGKVSRAPWTLNEGKLMFSIDRVELVERPDILAELDGLDREIAELEKKRDDIIAEVIEDGEEVSG